MTTTDKLPFPPNLPPLPEPPAGHEWEYRGMGWNPGDERSYITSHVIRDVLQWIESEQTSVQNGTRESPPGSNFESNPTTSTDYENTERRKQAIRPLVGGTETDLRLWVQGGA